jgi:broad specificity phosphatase PhoE
MTTPTTIILCRHGESEGNRDARFGGHGATPLTEFGRAQALATGRSLASAVQAPAQAIDVIYSSDLARAEQTAQIIGDAVGIPVQTTPALRERSVGIFTGLTFDEARERFPNDYAALLQRDADSCPPGGESYQQCRERAAAFLEQAVLTHRAQCVLLVSHHLTLYQLMLHVFGIQPNLRRPRVYLKIDNCSLHRLERYADGVWQVLSLNDCAHLSALVSAGPRPGPSSARG